MKKNEIKEMIDMYPLELFEFEYDGKYGNIDTYYIPEEERDEYLLYFDDEEITVNSLEKVMTTKFICGKSLEELEDEIIVFER